MTPTHQLNQATRRVRNLTLVGYFGILLLLPLWIWWLSPPQLLSQSATTLFWWCPALMPLKGILLNRPFTYAWSGFLAVFYISQAITTLVSSDSEQYLALIELVLAACWFAGASLFSRWRGQELGLELKKVKKQQS